MKSILLIVGLLLGVCLCDLKITEPLSTPFPRGQIPYGIGNFGDIPYGKTLSGELQLYSQPDLCSTTTPLPHNNAILVTLRGNCSFVTKALNAQSIGAKMLIIADNINETKKIIMGDDGRGRLVHIPSLFVNYTDGVLLIDFVSKATTAVKVMLDLKVNRTDQAEVRLWLNAADRETYVLVREFYQYYAGLQNYIKLNVSYYSMQCDSCPDEDCYLYNKSYCQIDPTYYQPGSGRYIIEQQFRQYQIFNQGIDNWFKYMDKFDQRCMKWQPIPQCPNAIMNELNIQVNISSSEDNMKLLENWHKDMVQGGVSVVPDATINGINYLGSMDAQDIAQMVCASLNSRPQGCSDFFQVSAPSSSHNFTVALAIITTIFIILVVCGIIVLVYKKTVRKEITNQMSTKVKEMVTKYATLVNEHEKKGKEREIERSREDL